MALSVRSLKAMASIVRSSVRMKSGTEQVAEPSSVEAMQLHPSPKQADPPFSCSFQARLLACSGMAPVSILLRPWREHRQTELVRPEAHSIDLGDGMRPTLRVASREHRRLTGYPAL
jgi:hypothetical protein